MNRKRIFLFLSTLLISLFTISFFAHPFLFVNTTFSAPVGLYIKNPSPNFEKNSFVVIDREDVKIRFQNTRLLKRIEGVEGDWLYQTQNALYVNSVEMRTYPKIQATFSFDLLPSTPFQVPQNKLIVRGEGEASLDSRYLGLIDKENVISVLPVITFTEEETKKIDQFFDF